MVEGGRGKGPSWSIDADCDPSLVMDAGVVSTYSTAHAMGKINMQIVFWQPFTQIGTDGCSEPRMSQG